MTQLLENLIPAPEAAKLLGVSDEYIHQQSRAGKIRYFMVGRTRRFLRGDLEAYLAGCVFEPSSQPAPKPRRSGRMVVNEIKLRHLKPSK